MDEIFDGDAISRADREFLASLDEHPLRRNPLYGTPCPPQPDFGPFDPKDTEQTAARLAFFADVVAWMLANYAYREGAFMGKGRRDLAGRRRDHLASGPARAHGAVGAAPQSARAARIKTRSPVEDWMLREGPALDPPRGDAPRPAAADLRRRTATRSSTATGRRCIRPTAASSRRSRASSPASSPTRRNGPGCGTGSPTRRAGRGCRWSR